MRPNTEPSALHSISYCAVIIEFTVITIASFQISISSLLHPFTEGEAVKELSKNTMFVGNIVVYIAFFIVTLIRLLSRVEANTAPHYWNTRLGSLIDYARIRPAGVIDYSETGPRMQLMASNGTNLPITGENIRYGFVVLIDVCSFGIVVAALATGLTHFAEIEDVDPLAAPYYTRAYRWITRHLDAFPAFLKGHKGYSSTHQLWYARPTFNRKYIPKWLRIMFLPFVSEEKWKKEVEHEKLFEPNIVYFLRAIPTLVNATGIGNETHNPYYGYWGPKPSRGFLKKVLDFVNPFG